MASSVYIQYHPFLIVLCYSTLLGCMENRYDKWEASDGSKIMIDHKSTLTNVIHCLFVCSFSSTQLSHSITS